MFSWEHSNHIFVTSDVKGLTPDGEVSSARGYLQFLWRNYHRCQFRRGILQQKYFYIGLLLSIFICLYRLSGTRGAHIQAYLTSIGNPFAQPRRDPHPWAKHTVLLQLSLKPATGTVLKQKYVRWACYASAKTVPEIVWPKYKFVMPTSK